MNNNQEENTTTTNSTSQAITHFIIGRIGSEFTKTTTPNGKTVVNFSLAQNVTTRRGKETKWFNVKGWNGMAEALTNNVGQGDLVKFRCSAVPNAFINKEGSLVTEQILTVTRFKLLRRKAQPQTNA